MNTFPTPAAGISKDELLLALGQLLRDTNESVEDLRDMLVSSSEPEQLVHVIPDLLAVIVWRLDLGCQLAGFDGPLRSDAVDLFVRPSTANQLGLRGGAA